MAAQHIVPPAFRVDDTEERVNGAVGVARNHAKQVSHCVPTKRHNRCQKPQHKTIFVLGHTVIGLHNQHWSPTCFRCSSSDRPELVVKLGENDVDRLSVPLGPAEEEHGVVLVAQVHGRSLVDHQAMSHQVLSQ